MDWAPDDLPTRALSEQDEPWIVDPDIGQPGVFHPEMHLPAYVLPELTVLPIEQVSRVVYLTLLEALSEKDVKPYR